METKKTIACPRCGEKTVWSDTNEHRPFCSDRCKNSDFIAWANEEQKISEDNDYSDFMTEDSMNQLQ
jgi:endogenous inhibitor of DNA gyrase (YacG/DUF329 family)